MNVQEKRATLRAHPDTITVTVGGEPRPWAFGRWGLRLARAAGIDVDRVLALFSGEAVDPGAMLEVSGDLVAIGLFPFTDDALDVVDLAPLSEVTAALPAITEAMGAVAEAAGGGDEGNAGAGSS